jgi:tetratricopeptide (TPR) repeat protein
MMNLKKESRGRLFLMNADGYYTLGNTYEEKLMFDEAASCYREAVRIDPNHSLAYARLGFALYNRRKIEEATEYLVQALQLNPNYDEAYCCLGMICREQGLFDDAIAYFKKALEINPGSAWVYTNLGVTVQQNGRYEEGRQYLRKAIEMNPQLKGNKNLHDLLLRNRDALLDKTNMQEQSAKKILIIVAAFNRKKITALSLDQTKRYKTPNCCLHVYNDHSTEYDNTPLYKYADDVIQLPNKMGIDKLRWYQFRKFLESRFDFLYFTDSDVIHDPQYVFVLDVLYEQGRRSLPVSLFNSIFTFRPKMILHYNNGIFLKTTAPGISMFYDRQMVEKILSVSGKIGNAFDYLPWDNRAAAFLGLPWITPEISYLEHFGANGINNDSFERDRAINPTEYLQERRERILQYLRQDTGDEPEL